jgi:hypothetical protein
VCTLVLEGIKGGIWEADAVRAIDEALTMKENEQALTNTLFGRNLQERRSKFAVEIGLEQHL